MKKIFWLIFLRHEDGYVECRGFGHNTTADYKEYIGTKEIEIDFEELRP